MNKMKSINDAHSLLHSNRRRSLLCISFEQREVFQFRSRHCMTPLTGSVDDNP
jgi:hypothetical protein